MPASRAVAIADRTWPTISRSPATRIEAGCNGEQVPVGIGPEPVPNVRTGADEIRARLADKRGQCSIEIEVVPGEIQSPCGCRSTAPPLLTRRRVR